LKRKEAKRKDLDSSRHADEIPNGLRGLSEKTAADECGVLMSLR